MTNKELLTILGTVSGLTFYTGRAPLGTKLPYGVLVLGPSSNFASDNKVTQKIQTATVELYTEKKDETTEAALEAVLDNNDIPWDKDEGYDDGEQFYINYYSITRR